MFTVRAVFTSKAVLFAVLAYAASVTASNLTPLQVPAFASTQGLSEAQIGAAAMCEILVLAISTILATALPLRIGIVAGVLGPLVAAAGQAASIWVPGFATLCFVRGLVGLGCGLSGAIASKSISASSVAASAFGLANASSVIMIGSLLIGIPWLPAPDPSVRIFVPLVILSVFTSIAVFLSRGAFDNLVVDQTATDRGATPLPRMPTALLVLATLLIYVPIGGIWTFSVKFGTDLGMSERQASGLLLYAVFGGFIGGTASAAVERAVGMSRLVVLGCVGCLVACMAVGAAKGPMSYAVAFALYSAVYQFTISAFQVVGTVVDVSGRLPAILLGVTLIGYSIGSYVVGYLIESNQRDFIWTGGAVWCAAALAPALLAVRWVRRARHLEE